MLDKEELLNIQKRMKLIPETIGDLKTKKHHVQTFQDLKIQQVKEQIKKTRK